MSHIELFAGCGGMSLGLEAAGFDLYMANELSPMAAETFAFNLLGEDLAKLAKAKMKSEKSLWIKSAYSSANLQARLRENPFEFSKGSFSDLGNKTEFKGKLIVGNIDHFLTFLSNNKTICKKFKKQNIDLLSGGPPCQGFSLAGKRIKDDHKNLLPLSFAKFAGLIQPKVVLLENVKGITSPFTSEDGLKHYAWLEVAKAFVLHDFFPVCMLVNSKYFGVPQNRPRFIMLAFRKDIFHKLITNNDNSILAATILYNTNSFYIKVHNNRKHLNEIKLKDLSLYDIESNPYIFNGILLPKIKTNKGNFINAKTAIGDITSANKNYYLQKISNEYANELGILFKSTNKDYITLLQNHELRSHSYKVKARFRLHQIINNLNGIKKDALKVISGNCQDESIVKKVFKAFKDEYLLIKSGNIEYFDKPKNFTHFKNYLKGIESKKHSQRAIKGNEPAPAQMTIPDDLCHYSENELRTLTVREMARFQSFPDSFVFRSKVTTGGNQRVFEVPQYTQVGNAVPPLLAYEIGKTLSSLLKSIE